jgi:cytochrome c2
MENSLELALKSPRQRITARRVSLLFASAGAAVLLLAGCAVEVENTRAAEELAQLAKPPGSVYTGWRVFQDRCAGCHGATATGTVGAPDLLPKVRDLNSRQFVNLVLTRYDWGLAVAQANRDSVARDTLVEDLLQRKNYMLTMPAWQGEPRVNAHIVDLYAFLSARADGTQGPGRPVP